MWCNYHLAHLKPDPVVSVAGLRVPVGAEAIAPDVAVARRAPAAEVPGGAGAARQVDLLPLPGDHVGTLGRQVELRACGEGVGGRGHQHQLLRPGHAQKGRGRPREKQEGPAPPHFALFFYLKRCGTNFSFHISLISRVLTQLLQASGWRQFLNLDFAVADVVRVRAKAAGVGVGVSSLLLLLLFPLSLLALLPDM